MLREAAVAGGVSFGELRFGDWPGLSGPVAAGLESLFDSVISGASVAATLAGPFTRCWVAWDDAGHAICILVGSAAGADWELEVCVTAAPARRQGVARRLLRHANRELAQSGFERVLLEVRRSNLAAILLYRSLGFCTISERKQYYSKPLEDALIMSLTLSVSPASSRKAWLVAPLHRREDLGNAYHVLTFDLSEHDFACQPGQFIMLRGSEWGDAPLLPRPMSVLSSGAFPSVLIKVAGEGTRRMARTEVGEPFSLLGPLGTSWQLPAEGRRAVLVAGGVGVAPLLFWARELERRAFPLVVVYGGRSQRDLPLLEELESLCQVHVTTEDGSRGERGRVTLLMNRVLTAHDEVYTCGPDAMMAKVAAYCQEQHLPCQASLETPMACGYGVCLGCAVQTSSGSYLYACMQGPCVDAASVRWQQRD